jgi:hypothetical protein
VFFAFLFIFFNFQKHVIFYKSYANGHKCYADWYD